MNASDPQKTVLRLATRKSKLALAQARAYAGELRAANDGLSIEELLVVTTGDRIQDRSLQAIGGKGLFIKEIEQALIDDAADIAVHSIKDVPADLAEQLVLASTPKRADPRDVLVTASGAKLADLPDGARIGTLSLRRQTMLLRVRPDLRVGPMRGNVDTRLAKLKRGEADAIVLAYAGLLRLGMGDVATEIFEPEVMLPAVGQGALGIECRASDDKTKAVLQSTSCPDTWLRVAAERAFMKAVGGSCQLPVAAFALQEGDEMWLRAMTADPDGQNPRYGECRVAWGDIEVARQAGLDLGADLR